MSNNQPPTNTRKSATLRSATRQNPLNHTRRQSASERIDAILENARDRADSIAAESISSATPNASPDPDGGVLRTRRTLSFQDVDDAHDPSERTAFLQRRLSSQNYQTMRGGGGDVDMGPMLPRKSVYERPRSSLQDEPAPEEQSREDGEDGGATVVTEPKWWDKAFAPFRSIELENKGSVARDHLALERTFLAWLRTSLAFTSIGIAVTQLFRLNTSLSDSEPPLDHTTLRHVGKPLGAAFLVISIMILLLGYRRFFRGQQWIMQGKFPASRGTVMLMVLVTLGIMILSLVVVVVIHPQDVD